jgi:biopolymer transport protein ExbB
MLDGLQFLQKGGPMMWPLLVCAILSVAVMIERSIVLSRANKSGQDLAESVKGLLQAGRDQTALEAVRRHDGPVAALLGDAIQNSSLPYDLLEKRLEERALKETPKLTARLNVLDTIITISPLLGLLGTVTGMIAAFHVVGDPASANAPAAITGGVAEALIATATGLTVAIVTLIGYNMLGEKVKTVISSMELSSTQVLNILATRTTVTPPILHETATTRA